MRRSRENICESILMLCREPVTLTKIVYSCNLNFKNAKVIIEELLAAGLIVELPGEQVNQQGIYQTSEKGIKALEYINALKDMFKPV